MPGISKFVNMEKDEDAALALRLGSAVPRARGNLVLGLQSRPPLRPSLGSPFRPIRSEELPALRHYLGINYSGQSGVKSSSAAVSAAAARCVPILSTSSGATTSGALNRGLTQPHAHSPSSHGSPAVSNMDRPGVEAREAPQISTRDVLNNLRWWVLELQHRWHQGDNEAAEGMLAFLVEMVVLAQMLQVGRQHEAQVERYLWEQQQVQQEQHLLRQQHVLQNQHFQQQHLPYQQNQQQQVQMQANLRPPENERPFHMQEHQHQEQHQPQHEQHLEQQQQEQQEQQPHHGLVAYQHHGRDVPQQQPIVHHPITGEDDVGSSTDSN